MFQRLNSNPKQISYTDRLKCQIDYKIIKIAEMVKKKITNISQSNNLNRFINNQTQTQNLINQSELFQNQNKIKQLAETTRDVSETCSAIQKDSITNIGNLVLIQTQLSIDYYIDSQPSQTIISVRPQIQTINTFKTDSQRQPLKDAISEQQQQSQQHLRCEASEELQESVIIDQNIICNECNESVEESLKEIIYDVLKQNKQIGCEIQPNNTPSNRRLKKSEELKVLKQKSRNTIVQSSSRNHIEGISEITNQTHISSFLERQKESRYIKAKNNNLLQKHKQSKQIILRIQVSEEVKDKMSKVSQEMSTNIRKEPNDHTARTNLLKRIQEKYIFNRKTD